MKNSSPHGYCKNDADGWGIGLVSETLSTPAQVSSSRHISYRPDIDGLRALSVISVIGFHLAPGKFPAGGIGVDIFLVISGYLIGGIVISSYDLRRFSYREFYLRRIRRILPALLVCISVSTCVALTTMYPKELMDFSYSALCAIFGTSNIFYYRIADYFAPNSSTMPLLHTWTLGVEEQFYLILPPMVGLMMKVKRSMLCPSLLLICFISLAISQYQVVQNSPAAFYLLPSRAWELGAGVLASQFRPKLLQYVFVRVALGVTGLALIVGSLILLRPETGFPGLTGLPPTLGAVMVLVGGAVASSPVHRLLGVAPMRLIGLASFSLYLWHWPIIVFFKLEALRGALTPIMAGEVLILTTIAGFFSWRFIEVPTRARSLPTRQLLIGLATLTAVLLLGQAIAIESNGLPARIPAPALRLFGAVANSKMIEPDGNCVLTGEAKLSQLQRAKCFSFDDKKPSWLLVGDSHAGMLYYGLSKVIPGIHIQTAVVLGCNVRIDAQPDGKPCGDLMNFIFSDYIWHSRIKGVIFTGRPEVLKPAELEVLGTRLKSQGKKLLVVGPTPGFTVPVARILAEAWRRGDPELPSKVMPDNIVAKDLLLRTVALSHNFEYLSAVDAMCRNGQHCQIADENGLPLYFDGDHYTPDGSIRIWARMMAFDQQRGGAIARMLVN